MLIEGVPFRGKLAKVQIVSDSTHYGPYEPGEYAQRLTLNNKGQVYLTRYYRGEEWDKNYSKREIFKIPSPDQIFFLLEYVFSKKHEYEWATDVGSWDLTLTNNAGEKFFFSGSLMADHGSIYCWASEIIRKELNLFSLYLFDGEYEERPSELVFCKVQFDDFGKEYVYLADTDTYHEGDYVVVPVGPDNHEAIAKIVSVVYRQGARPLYPLNKVKHIIEKYEESDKGQMPKKKEEVGSSGKPSGANADWKINFDLSEEHEAAYDREQFEKTMHLMEIVDKIGLLMNKIDRYILQFSDVFYIPRKDDIQGQIQAIMRKYYDMWDDPRNQNYKNLIPTLDLGVFVPCTLNEALAQFIGEWKKGYYHSDNWQEEIDALLSQVSKEIEEYLGVHPTCSLILSDEDIHKLKASKVYCSTILSACCFQYGEYLVIIMLSFLD